MQQKRRSGRIAKELAIVLLGTDATGKVFSEETITVVLSRHGAGVVTRYRFSPDERLTLRLPSSAKEAEIRLVGQIGGEPGRLRLRRHLRGSRIPTSGQWSSLHPIRLNQPASGLPSNAACAKRAQDVEQGDIEEDVYSATGNILRHCAECGTTTPWKKATGEALPVPAIALAKLPSNLPSLPLAPRASKPSSIDAPMHSSAESFEIELPTSGGPASTALSSSYSASFALSEFAALSDIQISPTTTSTTAVLTAPSR